MYRDEIFESALKEKRESAYAELQTEISGMELAIEKFLNNVLECTTFISERDFNVTTL